MFIFKKAFACMVLIGALCAGGLTPTWGQEMPPSDTKAPTALPEKGQDAPLNPPPTVEKTSGNEDDDSSSLPKGPLFRVLSSFLNVGGYFFSEGSGRSALGDVKFSSDTLLYGRPKHRKRLTLRGGLEIVSAKDHFLPFTGGNQFSLIGPSFRLTYHRPGSAFSPYLSGGLFAGRVRSVQQGFDRTDFTPGASAGVDWRLNRLLTLNASYRANQYINGVNTNGFIVSIGLFR